MTKITRYIQDSAEELLHKVSWPTWAELQNSAIIVMIASVIFALIIFVMDQSFTTLMEFIYSLF